MKKYLVLGGNGFIGRYIVDKLSLENEVVVADYNIEHQEERRNVTYQKIDFVNCNDFSEYLTGVDTVIHLISTIGPGDRTDTINQEIAENVFPTVRLLEDMQKNNVSNIIFASSGGTVYGEHNMNKIRENEKKQPICNYGIIKDLIEKYLYLYQLYYGINYRIVRLSNPYSDIVKKGKKQGIIPILIDQISKGETIKIWGDGEDVRDYIYIDDAITAILEVINYSGPERIFNIGTGKGYSIHDLLSIIQKEMQKEDFSIEYVDGRKCDVQNNILDIEKITQETGWTPKVSLEEGVQKVIEMRKR